MNLEDKAKLTAVMVRDAAAGPLFAAMPSAKGAVLALAAVVEEMAHEVEILKIRVGLKGGE